MSEPSRDAVAEALEVFTGLDPSGRSYVISAGVTLVAEIKRLEAELGRRGAAPDGWRLVPVEPTEVQLVAGATEAKARNLIWDVLLASKVYRAMLAASPAPYAAPAAPDGLLREARERLWEAHKRIHGEEVFKLRPDLCSMCGTLAKLDAALSALLDAPPDKNLGSS